MFALKKKNSGINIALLAQKPADNENLSLTGKKNSTIQVDNFNSRDYETMFSMSKDALVSVNDFGEIIKCNKAFLTLNGFDTTTLEGMHFLDLFTEADRKFMRSTIQTLATTENTLEAPGFAFEAQMRTADDSTVNMHWNICLRDETLYCKGRDIGATTRQSQALNRREKQLAQAESIGRMGHWNWVVGKEAIEWSDEIYRIFGVEKGSFAPTLQALENLVHREDRARFNQALHRAIIEENNYDMEFRICRDDGETRHIRCEGRCAFDDEGEVIALYGMMQDMTERILYERDLRSAKDQAEQAYAARTQFLANMSHELRTPLNAIIGFSEMMQRQLLGPIGTEKYLEYIGGIRESGEHLLDLISDILDMSKIEAGKYDLAFEKVNIAKVFKLTLHMVEARAQDAGVRIKMDNISEDLCIIADRRAILQIVLNIASNAVKFTKKGGEVFMSVQEREDHILLKITDTGVGIPAHKIASVTKPFEQVSSSYAREHSGSGLGLSITKDLTEMHGGSLYIESRLGEGTSVSVRLPKDASKKIKNSV